MLDNGKSPGKSFPEFSFEEQIQTCHLDVAVTLSVVHTSREEDVAVFGQFTISRVYGNDG